MTTNKRQTRVREQQESYTDPYAAYPLIEERYEVIEGVRYDLKPAPTVHHQQLVTSIWGSLSDTCAMNGEIFVSPIDVYLNEDYQFQPDIIFITNENRSIIKKKRIEGAPDLIVEILSPSTGWKDKQKKKEAYGLFGVKEYWLVDPHLQTVDQLVLIDGELQLHQTYGHLDTLTAEQFPCISVDFEKLFGALIKFEDDE